MAMTRPSRRSAFQRLCAAVGHAVVDYRMVAEGDRLLVGLSGGEDSLALMHALTHLQRRAPVSFEIHAATVDMGFPGFDLAALSAYCQAQGWPHEVVSLPGEAILEEKNHARRPCGLCSRLRRGQLHGLAERLGCGTIALGQQLDDLAVSLLMSLFRGHGLKTMGPHVAADAGSKRLIRPLCYVPKALVHEVALDMAFPTVKSCPYLPLLDAGGDRARLTRLLDDLDGPFPNLRQNLLASLRRVETAHLLDRRWLQLPPTPSAGGEPNPDGPEADHDSDADSFAE